MSDLEVVGESGLSAPDAPPLAAVDLLAQLPDVVLVVDAEGTLIWANAACQRELGLDPADWTGRSALELIHPDDQEMAVLSLSSVMGKETGSPLELRVRAADEWRLVEVVGAPLRPQASVHPTGSPGLELIAIVIRDLTERRRWEVAHDSDELFRSLVQYSGSLTMLLADEARIVSVSGSVTRLLGLDPEQLEGRHLSALVDDRDVQAVVATLDRAPALYVDRRVSVDVRLRTSTPGLTIPYHLTVVDLADDPTVKGYVVTGHDISPQVAAEADLRSAVSLLNATLESTADGILVVDTAGDITNFNARFAQMWGIPPALADSGDPAAVSTWLRDQLVERDQPLTGTNPVAGDRAETFDVVRRVDGRVFERATLPLHEGEQIVGRVACFRDVTEQERLRSELEHQAFHDALTGLANQALFRDRVDHAISRSERTSQAVSVLYLDLDGFKKVNDSLGHPVGDRLLVEVTRRLMHCIRRSDTPARLGGDEFAVLLEEVPSPDVVTEIAQRINDSLQRPVTLDGSEIFVTASVGVAFHEPGMDTGQLLRNADLAMYSAKRAGKARYALFEAEMHEVAVNRLSFEADLRHAVERDELAVLYQPIVDTGTGRLVSVEALVRWDHPDRGRVGPDLFIPLAEETGLIGELGSRVLEQAVGQAAAWRRLPGMEDLSVSVNLSVRQLADHAVVDVIRHALEQSGLPPRDLVVELTETAIMSDAGSVGALEELCSFGVRLALDDFGTGYSSLTYLQRLPVDMVKIDRVFVAAMADKVQLIEAIIGLARTLELGVVAEGVEDDDQLQLLRRLGCPLAQGYLFARPLEVDELEDFAAGLIRSG